jgi:hypothetical protein
MTALLHRRIAILPVNTAVPVATPVMIAKLEVRTENMSKLRDLVALNVKLQFRT